MPDGPLSDFQMSYFATQLADYAQDVEVELWNPTEVNTSHGVEQTFVHADDLMAYVTTAQRREEENTLPGSLTAISLWEIAVPIEAAVMVNSQFRILNRLGITEIYDVKATYESVSHKMWLVCQCILAG